MFVMSFLPQISFYLEIMKSIHLSTQHLPILKNSLELFQQICFEFLQSEKLKLFLHFILYVGNILNSHQVETGNESYSLGFRCESLLKLKLIKTNSNSNRNEINKILNKNQNLVFYIIRTLKSQGNQIYNFFYEMKLFYDIFIKNKNLNNLNIEVLFKEFSEIQKEIEEVRKKYTKIIDDDVGLVGGVDISEGRMKVENYFEKVNYIVYYYFLIIFKISINMDM